MWQRGRLHLNTSLMARSIQIHVLFLCCWHFHAYLLQGFPHCSSSNSSTSFSLAHSTMIIREHHLPRCFFSDVFRQWIDHDGKQERADSGTLVEANFHCKGFACSCSTRHYSFALMIHMWITSLMYSSGTPLFACINTVLPLGLYRTRFPDQWTHSMSCCVFLAAVLAQT